MLEIKRKKLKLKEKYEDIVPLIIKLFNRHEKYEPN